MISSGIWHKYSVNTTSDISELLYVISRAGTRVNLRQLGQIDFPSWELIFAIFRKLRKYPVPSTQK